jgi:hypothetical protein
MRKFKSTQSAHKEVLRGKVIGKEDLIMHFHSEAGSR